MNADKRNLDKRKLAWACRRGMLELDILLNRYLEERYELASLQDQAKFRSLLECQDQDLFDWMIKKQPCEDENLIEIIVGILR